MVTMDMVDMEDMDTAMVAMDTMARGKLNQQLMLPQDMVIMVTPPMGMVVTDTAMDMDIMEREKLRPMLLLKPMLLQDILITVTLLMVMDTDIHMDMVMVMDIMEREKLRPMLPQDILIMVTLLMVMVDTVMDMDMVMVMDIMARGRLMLA